jgi:CBS-domain-containing membrane protein
MRQLEMVGVRASEVMTRSVLTVHTGSTVQQAAALLCEHGITSLPVLDEDDRVVGIVSEVDLIRDRMPHDPRSHLRPLPQDPPDPSRLVVEVMQEPVVCLAQYADVADLAAVMLDNNVRAVPITDAGRLLGIVSRRDLLRTLLRDDDAIRADVERLLDESSGVSGQCSVAVANGVVTLSGSFEDPAQKKTVTRLAQTVPGVLRVHTHRRRRGDSHS